MGRFKPVSLVMAAVMLVSVLASCSSPAKKKNYVVKEDDPWYESTKFKLDFDRKSSDETGGEGLCASRDRLFSVYCVSSDTWETSRTVLDTYDFEGNLISRNEVIFPDELQLFSLFSAKVDPEGKTLNAIVNFTFMSDHNPAFISIDTKTGEVTDIKDLYDKKSDDVVKPRSSLHYVEYVGDYAVAVLLGNYQGGLLFNWQMLLYKDNEFVTEFDMSTINFQFFMGGFAINQSTDSLFAVGYEGFDTITAEFDIKTGSLKNKGVFRESGDDAVNFAEYSPTCNGDLCKMDSLGNITKIDINTMTSQTVIDANWYTPYFYSIITDEQSCGSTVVKCGEDMTIILDYESITYGCDDYKSTEYCRILKKAEKNPHAGKVIIELAFPPNSGVTEYLAQTIYEFNQTDDEYLIRLWDKYKSGFTVGRSIMLREGASEDEEKEQRVFQMIQDLRGDDAPDIAIGIQNNYAMRDDIFMDLTSFLDPEVMDKQFGNIIEASRFDGKLYFLPVTLEIEGLVTNENLLNDGAVGITFEEFDKLIKEKMDGFSPYDYPGSTAYNKRSFLLSCIDTKTAIEGEKVEFGTAQFLTASEYAAENFVYDDTRSMPVDEIYSLSRYRGECYYSKMDDYLDYVKACFKDEGNYQIIGTPSVDASGPRFVAIETISVSATTGVTDGCKKFLNYLFSGSAYASKDCNFRKIVTNREIMVKNIETLSRLNNESYTHYRDLIDKHVLIPAPGIEKQNGNKFATDEMQENFLNSLSSISIYYYEDREIVRFVMEELAPYYAGDRTIDDVVRFVNDRTTTYIREM